MANSLLSTKRQINDDVLTKFDPRTVITVIFVRGPEEGSIEVTVGRATYSNDTSAS